MKLSLVPDQRPVQYCWKTGSYLFETVWNIYAEKTLICVITKNQKMNSKDLTPSKYCYNFLSNDPEKHAFVLQISYTEDSPKEEDFLKTCKTTLHHHPSLLKIHQTLEGPYFQHYSPKNISYFPELMSEICFFKENTFTESKEKSYVLQNGALVESPSKNSSSFITYRSYQKTTENFKTNDRFYRIPSDPILEFLQETSPNAFIANLQKACSKIQNKNSNLNNHILNESGYHPTNPEFLTPKHKDYSLNDMRLIYLYVLQKLNLEKLEFVQKPKRYEYTVEENSLAQTINSFNPLTGIPYFKLENDVSYRKNITNKHFQSYCHFVIEKTEISQHDQIKAKKLIRKLFESQNS